MQSKLYRRLLIVFGMVFLLAAACSFPTQRSTETPANTSQTQVAETVNALMTEVAGKNITSTSAAPPTNTPQAPTLAPSSTPQPTATQIILPSPTITTICDQAGFVADVTIPDGTTLPAGAQFDKTWRLKNTGTCTWTEDYSIVFESGASMDGPASQRLGESVPPGDTIDVTVRLKAPGSPGTHRGNWKLRNAAGVLFGIGSNSQRFYVEIKVEPVTSTGPGYNFAANYCVAEWTGNGKTLPCLGKDGDEDGFVLYQSKPILESGYVDDEPALITNPPRVTDGVIRGKYPAYTVKDGDRFVSLIGCEHNAKNCNVRFQLDYQIDNGSIQTIAAWNEAYEGNYTTIDVDLSSLAGNNVKFILTVMANGSSDGDRAMWLVPRIVSK